MVPKIKQTEGLSLTRRVKAVAATVLVVLLGVGALTACEPADARQAVQAHWGTGADFACVDKIIHRESRWQPAAKNKSSSATGLFQILTTTHAKLISQHGYTKADMVKAGPNAKVAKELSKLAQSYWGDRWAPWRLSGKPIRGGGCPA
jgi:soluble lytic murein transglycosylase-like protein